MRNNTTISLCILAVLLVCFLFIAGIAHAQTVPELRQAMEDAEDLVEEKEDDHEEANDHLNEMVRNFVTLHANLVNIKISAIPATSTWEFAAAFTQIVEALTKANLLTDAMRTMLTNIETQRDSCNTLWADVLLAQTAYENAIDAFNENVSPSERVTTVEVPQAPPVAPLYLCPGPCSTPFTTKVLATTSHKVFCQEPPHKGTNKYSYYSCPPDYENLCPARSAHQTPCHGGCGTLFAQNTGLSPRPDSVHIKQCDERTSRNIFNFWTGNCIGYYYNCNGQTSADCSNAPEHIKEDSSSSKSASLSGSGSATAGSTYKVTLTTPKPFRKLYWYVKVPGASKSKLLTTMQGGSSSTSASYTYYLANSAPAGNHVLNVLYYDYSDGEASYIEHTVSVSAKLMACGHAIGTPGNHNYVRCPRAKDGARCRADKTHPGYHLACDTSHVHQYGPTSTTPVSKPKETTSTDTTPTPTTPKKENPPLTTPKDTTPTDTPPKDTTPKETQPQPKSPRPKATCSAGHSYFTDRTWPVNHHKDRTCTRCSLTYQNCSNHSSACQNSKWHTDDPSAAPKSPTPTTPTPTTPTPTTPTPTTPVPQAPSQVTYHACGVHESSVSGDHSLQASCSETNSNGDRCTVSSFYACQSHTHQYPAPKKPDPPKPKVVCPADSWTKCGGTVSHAATCQAGHTYYTCNPSAVSAHSRHKKPVPKSDVVCSSGHRYDPESDFAVNKHRVRTCRFSACGQTWQRCVDVSAPICSKPYRKKNGLSCWAK